MKSFIIKSRLSNIGKKIEKLGICSFIYQEPKSIRKNFESLAICLFFLMSPYIWCIRSLLESGAQEENEPSLSDFLYSLWSSTISNLYCCWDFIFTSILSRSYYQ
jgi:hypothetical protein